MGALTAIDMLKCAAVPLRGAAGRTVFHVSMDMELLSVTERFMRPVFQSRNLEEFR